MLTRTLTKNTLIFAAFCGLFCLALLSACGGSGDEGSSSSTNYSGRVVDGVVTGAQIFVDRNGNGVYDRDRDFPAPESVGEDGSFSIRFVGHGVLTVVGGIDTTTDGPFRGILRLNTEQVEGNTDLVVSPLSTLAHALGDDAEAVLQSLTSSSVTVALRTDPSSGTEQTALTRLSIRFQKTVEALSQEVVRTRTSSSIRTASSSSIRSFVAALDLDNVDMSALTIETLFSTDALSTVAALLGLDEAEAIAVRLDFLQQTIEEAEGSPAEVLRTAEFIAQVYISTTELTALINAQELASEFTTSTLLTLDLYELANIALSTSNLSEATRQATVSDLPVFDNFPYRLDLDSDNILSIDVPDSRIQITIVFEENGNAQICFFHPEDASEDTQHIPGEWSRPDRSNSLIVLEYEGVAYRLSSIRTLSDTYVRRINSNIPISEVDDAEVPVSVGIVAEEDVRTFSADVPRSSDACDSLASSGS